MKKKTKSKINSKFDLDRSKKKRKLFHIYEEFLSKLGLEKSPREVNKVILYISGGAFLLTLLSVLIYGLFIGSLFTNLFTLMIATSVSVGVVVFILSHLFTLLFLEVRLYNRTKQIEEHLPDFLQLASVNISAGMPVDRALWYSVRSKFGILAVEMERIAKETVAGKELEDALIELSEKYDSKILKETVHLINEGMNAGGEMSELLNKVSENIYETRVMKKEIAASVMTYAIFIGIGSIVGAPILLALSTQLLKIVTTITGDMDFDGGEFQTFSFDTDGISIDDFQSFALIIIAVSAFFSASIVSVIRKGSVKDGLKLIPIFMLAGMAIYWVSVLLFELLMSGFV